MESSPPDARDHARASSILVVDDDPASGELAARLLSSQGYSVQMVGDGKQAIDVLRNGGVDLLVLDLMMSKLDGVEVCAHVRNELGDLFLPIIITTSLYDRESRIRAKEAGADDVIVKPLDGLELLVRVESLLRTRAGVAALMRERDRLAEELRLTNLQLANQERTLRAVESLAELIERQRRALERGRKPWSQLPEAREYLQRSAELAAELTRCLECLIGPEAAAQVLSRAQSSGQALESRRSIASATE